MKAWHDFSVASVKTAVDFANGKIYPLSFSDQNNGSVSISNDLFLNECVEFPASNN